MRFQFLSESVLWQTLVAWCWWQELYQFNTTTCRSNLYRSLKTYLFALYYSAWSELEALLNALYKFSTFLLTYFKGHEQNRTSQKFQTTVPPVHRVTVTYFIHIISVSTVFPPLCGANSAKCLLLWHHSLSKTVAIRRFSETNRFNFSRITRQIFTT